MGFLDGTERIQDLVLTQEGRRQLSLGELEFRYFAVFDDGVDYSPLNYRSGSFSAEELEGMRQLMIEDTPMMEVSPGRVGDGRIDEDATLLPRSFLFDRRSGHRTLPTLTVSPDVRSGSLVVGQAMLSPSLTTMQAGILRQSSDRLYFSLSMGDDPTVAGFSIKVYESGSEGLREMSPRLDYSNVRSFGLHLQGITDEESGAPRTVGQNRGEGGV